MPQSFDQVGGVLLPPTNSFPLKTLEIRPEKRPKNDERHYSSLKEEARVLSEFS